CRARRHRRHVACTKPLYTSVTPRETRSAGITRNVPHWRRPARIIEQQSRAAAVFMPAVGMAPTRRRRGMQISKRLAGMCLAAGFLAFVGGCATRGADQALEMPGLSQ